MTEYVDGTRLAPSSSPAAQQRGRRRPPARAPAIGGGGRQLTGRDAFGSRRAGGLLAGRRPHRPRRSRVVARLAGQHGRPHGGAEDGQRVDAVQRAECRNAEGEQRQGHLQHDQPEHDAAPLPRARDGLGGEERDDQQDQPQQRHDVEPHEAMDPVERVAVVVLVDDQAVVDVVDGGEPPRGDRPRLDEHAQGDQPRNDAIGLLHDRFLRESPSGPRPGLGRGIRVTPDVVHPRRW